MPTKISANTSWRRLLEEVAVEDEEWECWTVLLTSKLDHCLRTVESNGPRCLGDRQDDLGEEQQPLAEFVTQTHRVDTDKSTGGLMTVAF